MAKSRRKYIKLGILAVVGLLGMIQLLLFVVGNHMEPSKQSFVVARDPNWVPFDFLNKEQRVTAFSDELLAAIAAEQKITIQIHSTNPSIAINNLDNGTYDGVLTPIIPRGYRSDRYIASEPYFRFGPVLVVRKTSGITQLSQLKGNAVGILRGDFLLLNQSGEADLTYVPYDNVLIALQHLENGIVDGVIIGAFPAYAYTKSIFLDRLKVVTPPLTDAGLRLVALKDRNGETLLKHFADGLQILKSNGTYQKILQKWGLIDPENLEIESPSPTPQK